jgi:hypothetical protein
MLHVLWKVHWELPHHIPFANATRHQQLHARVIDRQPTRLLDWRHE